ncbi:hypothetical protein V3C99_009170, partial [Haemonchus contortus]
HGAACFEVRTIWRSCREPEGHGGTAVCWLLKAVLLMRPGLMVLLALRLAVLLMRLKPMVLLAWMI